MILVIIQWSEWADWVDAMVEGDMENTGAMPDNSQAGLDLRKGGVTWCFTSRRLTETQKQSQRMKFSNKKKKSNSVTRCFECKDLKTHRQQGSLTGDRSTMEPIFTGSPFFTLFLFSTLRGLSVASSTESHQQAIFETLWGE